MSHSGSKKAISSEIIDLKKQVADLKESATARRRVEDALRDAEMLHRAALDECPVGIVRLDRGGRILYANPAFLKTLGYETRQDFNTIGALRGIFVNSEEARRVLELARGPATEIDVRCLRRDGKTEVVRLVIGGGGGEAVTLVEAGLGRLLPET
jgi:PAS domain S-box-containing protein